MWSSPAHLIVITLLASVAPLLAATPVATLDDGNMLLFVANDGSYGYDKEKSLSGYAGLYYPKGTLKALMAGAGLWISGKKDDRWHVTIAGGPTEFVPGPAFREPDSTYEFPVYKITRGEDYLTNDDYQTWPSHLGAPLNQLGQPLLRGSQALFTLFNDTDSSAHGMSISGTPPLGVEVRLYAYTFDNTYQMYDTILSQVVFFEYTITNVSGETIDSCIITSYADPDIGWAGSDLIGCDSSLAAAYCYNDGNHDIFYGPNPPAVGICLLEGDLTSFNYYHSKSPLDTVTQTVNLIKGLTIEGAPYINPQSGMPTNYPLDGNPVTGTGWINDDPQDYRLMLNLAPVSLSTGESLRYKMALIVTRGENVINGVDRFLQAAALIHELAKSEAGVELLVFPQPVFEISQDRFQGHDWGGRFLSGGLDLASRYLFTPDRNDSLPEIVISFADQPLQQAYRFCAGVDGYYCCGFTPQSVEVFDSNNSTRYDYAFIDTDADGDLTGADSLLEPLIIFTTPFTSSARESITAGSMVDAADLALLALELEETMESLAGRSITINANVMQHEFIAIGDTINFGSVKVASLGERVLKIRNRSKFCQEINISSDDPSQLLPQPIAFELGSGESSFVYLHFHPADSGTFSTPLRIHGCGYNEKADTLLVTGSADYSFVCGDADNDGKLDLVDLVIMIRILYRDGVITVPIRQLDADGDGLFDLTDLVQFINIVFHNVQVSCD